MGLQKHKNDWETLGKVDPLWAIYSRPQNQYGNWDQEEFFRTGEENIAAVMAEAAKLRLPQTFGSALDFGCGVGRLTRALGTRFMECVGVDISSAMVQQAQEFNKKFPNCRFVVNDAEHLKIFGDGAFDLIYTLWVLQHLPSVALMKGYVGEFVRTLKPGGLLVFQIRTSVPMRTQMRLGRTLYRVLHFMGIKDQFLYQRLGLSPMQVTALPEEEMIEFLKTTGCRLLKVQRYGGKPVGGSVFFVTK